MSYLCFCGASQCAILAQRATDANANKVVRAVRVESPPLIDGKLDDAVWEKADVITDFHQIRPGDGSAPSQLTEVYLLYDENALYIGARMYESNPELIAAQTVRHGQGLARDDRLVVILDPFNTGRVAFRFVTNLNGVRHDAIYERVDSFENNWTVVWDTASSLFEEGWTSELAIPFKSLPFDPAIETWGFNFGRSIRRRTEEVAWVSRNRSYNAAILGSVTGLSGMEQGLGLDVVPSVAVSRQKIYDPPSTEGNVEPSLDLFYRVTPSLNASLTINTDFSATEVDDRQVNLTRFSLFFPEKRDFFLTDKDLFEFGRIGGVGNQASSRSSVNNGRPFFSRRLGLSRSGQPVDLKYGGKLTGRIGRWNIGMLAMRQDSFESIEGSGVLVGRVSANVLDESSLGVIFTSGDPNSNLNNRLAGVDFRYLNTHLAGGRILEVDAWYQQSATDGLEGDDSTFGFGIRSPNNSGLRGGVYHKQIQKNFNPALGFVSRSDIKDTTFDAGYTYVPGGSLVQEIYSGFDAQHVGFLDGGLQSQVLLFRLLEIQTRTRDSLGINYTATKEVVTEPFTIYRDNDDEITIPPGSYSFHEQEIRIATGSQRDLAADFRFQTGDFFTGTRNAYEVGLSWTQSRHFGIDLSYERNDVTLAEGDFVTHLARLSTEVNFSSTLYWLNRIQYDNVSEVIGVNARLIWIPTAGQEGLIVFNHSLRDRDNYGSFRSELSDVTVKFSYTFRF